MTAMLSAWHTTGGNNDTRVQFLSARPLGPLHFEQAGECRLKALTVSGSALGQIVAGDELVHQSFNRVVGKKQDVRFDLGPAALPLASSALALAQQLGRRSRVRHRCEPL